jgi:HEAT repeat protein
MAFLRLASASLLVTFLLAAAGGCDGDGQHLRQLRSERPDDRAAAAALLGMHGDSRAIPALRVALRDSALKVRAKAAWALGMLRSKGAIPDLLLTLRDDHRRVRQQSAWALMQIEEPEVISALEMALQMEQDPWVQADLRRAAEHLRQFQGDVDLGESRFR